MDRRKLRSRSRYVERNADACAQLVAPLVEVHLSQPKDRPEVFRHHSVVTEHAVEVVAGHGIEGYRMALEHLTR